MNILTRFRLKAGIGSYPYANTRIRAMKADLLSADDYRKLKKMGASEITEHLQQTAYEKDINRFAQRFEGSALLEKAVDSHLSSIHDKLVRISPDEIVELLNAYLSRYDLENIKTVLRGRKQGLSFDEVEDMLGFTPSVGVDQLRELHDAESREELIRSVPFPVPVPDEDIPSFDSARDVEDFLDRHFYFGTMETVGSLLGSSNAFKRFMGLEARIRNILLALRLKRKEIEPDRIREHVLDVPYLHHSNLFEDVIEADSFEDAVDLVAAMDVGEHVKEKTLSGVERGLEQHRLEKGVVLLDTDPLFITPVLGYMIAKENEIRNIRILLEARKSGLDEGFITDNIVMEAG